MELGQSNMKRIYEKLEKMQKEIDLLNGKIVQNLDNLKFAADEPLLAEAWSSEEDNNAFAYLQ